MSGFEVVSIGLAILPLLISAAEHYDDCLRPFLRYKDIVSEIDHFQRHFRVQKTIFRNQCRILLEGALEHDAVGRMLGVGRGDPSWADQELEAKLTEQLGASKTACLTSIELIDENLCEIAKESRDMHALADEKQRVKYRRAKKLRCSLSLPRLDEHIKSLRVLNDDFIRLSNQTIEVTAQQGRYPRARNRVYEKEVSRCKAIGEASERIYEVLGRACTEHSEHLAHFCVNPVTDSAEEMSDSNLKFHIAFTRLPLVADCASKSKPGDSGPLWFMIDAVMEQGGSERLTVLPCRESLAHSNLKNSLKREFEQPKDDIPVPKKSQKLVRFQTPERVEPAPPPSFSTLLSVPRFRRDFCDMLRSKLGSTCSPATFIGLLENGCHSQHRVYAPSTEVLHNSNSQTTLLSILKSSRSNPGVRNELLIHEKLQIAKNLAVAVLQYHATPWMSICWRSRDIFLLSNDRGNDGLQDLNFSSLHMNVRVKERPRDAGIDSSGGSAQSLAPNNLLFSLGVTLLELAYSSDLSALQQPSDIRTGRDSELTEFFVAKRLAGNAIREMGGTYSRIVTKLLRCNFGCGDDLKDTHLQGLFYRDVVCELDNLEQGFRKLAL